MYCRGAACVAIALLSCGDGRVGTGWRSSAVFSVGVAVATQHNDNLRTGAYLSEVRINVASLSARGMIRRYALPVGAGVETQVLYVPLLSLGGITHNVAYVTTLANRVAAFDVDSGAQLWSTALSTLPKPGGIHATPVIDMASSTMYVLYRTKLGNYYGDNPGCATDADCAFRVAALDIRSGAVLRDRAIPVTLPGYPSLQFIAAAQNSRPGILFSGGSLFVAFGSYKEDTDPYRGWLMRIDPATLAVSAAITTSPGVAGHSASGIWQSGGGIAADEAGNIYVATGNGPPDLYYPNLGAGLWYGNSLLKLDSSLNVVTSFPSSTDVGDPPGRPELNYDDLDFGSGGVVLLPGTVTSHNVLSGGKPGRLYLTDDQLNRRQDFQAFFNMYMSDTNQPASGMNYPPYCGTRCNLDDNPHLHGAPVYWRGPDPNFGYVYAWSEKDNLKAFKYYVGAGRFGASFSPVANNYAPWAAHCPATNGDFLCNGKVADNLKTCPGDTPKAVMPGGMMSLSANGYAAGSGVLWATLPWLDSSNPCQTRDKLLAYDAQTLHLIWQDDFGWNNNVPIHMSPKWAVPTIADGKLLIGSLDADGGGSLIIYELGLNAPVLVRAIGSPDGSPVNVTWQSDDPGSDSFHVETQNGPSSPLLPASARSYSIASLAGGLGGQLRVCAHMRGDVACSAWQQPISTQYDAWFDISKVEIDQTGWGFNDVNGVAWAQAARVAFAFCTQNGFVGGQLNGHEALDSNGVVSRAGVICTGSATSQFFDTSAADRQAYPFHQFTDVNVVAWATASRNANNYCNQKGFAGGQYNGNQSAPGGLMGIVCYGGNWFDVAKSAPYVSGLSNQNLDYANWAESAAAANDWCVFLAGHNLGGRMNGWQGPQTDGTICY
jgi:hypothetical protein